MKPGIPILMYHSISSSSNPRFKRFAVSASTFAEQMAYLHDHRYTPITITQLVRTRSGSADLLPERPVVLTFDDGFADFFTAALPVLWRHRFVATLYVTTAYIGQTSQWLKRERETNRAMLTWDQLREVCAGGVECGGHTHLHPQLDILAPALAREEITQCKHILEDQLAQEICSFAYPYGYQTATTRRLVQDAGYLSACAVKHRLSTEADDPFALTRLMVSANTSLEEFALLLAGQHLSPANALYQMYARARTPVWQLVRRGTASITALQKKWTA